MEKASRRPWIQYEHSPRAMQLRECTPKEFWDFFVDDRPFGTDPANREADIQSKPVLSYAMTLMEKIRGGKTKKVGKVQVRCMYVDFYKRSFDKRPDSRSGTGKLPKETHKVHYALHELGL